MRPETLVSFRAFGAAFGQRTVLSEVSLEIPDVGMTCVVGPAGSGKSTLIRSIAGLNASHPNFRTWGQSHFGASLQSQGPTDAASGDLRPGVAIVVQHSRFFLDSVRENLLGALPRRAMLVRSEQFEVVTKILEQFDLAALRDRLEDDVASLSTGMQRRLAVVLALVREPRIVLADEPTSGLAENDSQAIVELLRNASRLRSVVVVTHDQRAALALGGTTMLLAGGRSIETSPTPTFFTSPASEEGAQFVRTGGCAAPSPDAVTEDLEATYASRARRPRSAATSGYVGPRGFFWVHPGRLGGLPRPGIVETLAHDLDGLERLGVDVLVTLEETRTVPSEALLERHVESVHFPIPDMDAPEVGAAHQLCERIADWLEKGRPVAVHCRAGLGRTGTILAACLVHEGSSARDAIERVRRLCPGSIQSMTQAQFLSSFESFVRFHRDKAETVRPAPESLTSDQNARGETWR